MKFRSPSRIVPSLLAPLALVAGAAAAPQYTSFSTLTSPPQGFDLGVDDVEITPDGRYAIYRDNAVLVNTRVVDLRTGQYVLQIEAGPGAGCTGGLGACADS